MIKEFESVTITSFCIFFNEKKVKIDKAITIKGDTVKAGPASNKTPNESRPPPELHRKNIPQTNNNSQYTNELNKKTPETEDVRDISPHKKLFLIKRKIK